MTTGTSESDMNNIPKIVLHIVFFIHGFKVGFVAHKEVMDSYKLDNISILNGFSCISC